METQSKQHLKKAPTKKRYFIVFLLFVTVVINYLDRTNLSIAAPAMVKDLGLSDTELGFIFSAWGIAYAYSQIPCGWLVDKVKPKYLLAIILLLWSLATISLGMVGNLFGIIALRFLIGMFEAPSYPINNKVVTTWIPDHERASAIGIYTSAQFIGLACLAPVLAILLTKFGWQSIFIITGIIGVFWAGFWFFKYNDPKEYPGISQEELDMISQKGAMIDPIHNTEKTDFAEIVKDFFFLLRSRKFIGICLGQFAIGGATIFFLTWFPTYLVEYHHMSFIKAGFMTSLPYICGLLGVLFSGFVSDFLYKKGCSLAVSRKIPIISGLCLTSFIVGAELFPQPIFVIIFMSIAFFATGFASITWSLVSHIAPVRLIGLSGGIFNFTGALAAIIVPIILGCLSDGKSFLIPLLFIAGLGICGALSYICLVGKVERIQDYK